MPPRPSQSKDESEPLLPTHAPGRASGHASSDARAVPPINTTLGAASTRGPTAGVADGPTAGAGASASVPASASLTPASKGKLQGRRYLSPETLRRPLLSADEEGADQAGEAVSGSASSGDGGSQRQSGRGLSEKARGKRRATADDADSFDAGTVGENEDESRGRGRAASNDATPPAHSMGRSVTVIFANEGPPGGKVDVWVDEGESVGKVKDKIRHLHQPLMQRSLRLIHSGRMLTDGVLLLPWLRSLEQRVRRQAAGMGGDVEEVLREVGLAEGDGDGAETSPTSGQAKGKGKGKDGSATRRAEEESKVFLHCTVGGVMGVEKAKDEGEGEEEPAAPRRRGFDVLLDAGLSAADVSQMRRQFYAGRGEDVPEGIGRGDIDDEHARALEEQWIEGDLTADTATTSTEGQYSSILKGLLMGFLYPILPLFYFRESPLGNFFDAEAEAEADSAARRRGPGGLSLGVAGITSGDGQGHGGEHGHETEQRTRTAVAAAAAAARPELTVSTVFETRVQMGVFIGLAINVVFGVLRFIN